MTVCNWSYGWKGDTEPGGVDYDSDAIDDDYNVVVDGEGDGWYISDDSGGCNFMKKSSSFFFFLFEDFLNNKNWNKQQQNTATISNQKVNHPVLSGVVSVYSFNFRVRNKPRDKTEEEEN